MSTPSSATATVPASNVAQVAASLLSSPAGVLAGSPERQCRLVQGIVALSAQLVLLAVVLTALFVKRHRERPRRPWTVWLLDIGKQACSSGAGHLVGMAVAIIASRRTEGSAHHASECGWYFVVYFMDCTLGLTLAISFHKLTTGTARWFHTRHSQSTSGQGTGSYKATGSSAGAVGSGSSSDVGVVASSSATSSSSAQLYRGTTSSSKHDPGGGPAGVVSGGGLASPDHHHHHHHHTSLGTPGRGDTREGSHANQPWWEALVEIGNYGDAASPSMKRWAVQVVFWVACVISARSIVGLVVVTFAPSFDFVTSNLDIYFRGHPDRYLYTVMVCIPLVVNVGQAWIQDQVLKWTHKRGHAGDKREDDDEVLLPVTGSAGDVSKQPLLANFSGPHQGARSKGGVLLSTLLGAATKPAAKTNDE